MTRTVAGLYLSRGEAEFARARLISEGARSPRIIAKDTAAAVDGLGLNPKAAQSCRDAVNEGGHLLVAQVPRGRSSKRLLQLLKDAMGKTEEPADLRIPDAGGIRVDMGSERVAASPPRQVRESAAFPSGEHEPLSSPEPAAPSEDRQPNPSAVDHTLDRSAEEPRIVEEARIPLVEETLRIDKQEVPRGGARMRAFTRETPVEADVDLGNEVVEVESRESGRAVEQAAAQSDGLFQERTFEFVEMREEPVVAKEAFVREELIIRKRVDRRTETVRDTVRHTEVEVEELPSKGKPAPALFGRAPDRPGS